MRALRMALRSLAREWKSGELGVLLLALSVAVAALTGVGFLVDRIGLAVEAQANEVLAADLRVSSQDPIPADWFTEGQKRNLRTARVTSVLSVVFNGEQSQLANLRVVTETYPLRGKVTIASEPFGVAQPTQRTPGRGEIWPDSKLLAAVGGRVGSTLSVGASTFKVSAVLISRPDEGSTFADLAPAALLNDADLAATRLLQPGSRASYAALFAGERDAVAAFKAWVVARNNDSARVRDVTEASPQIRSAVDRAGRFLNLASLVAVLLCCIAVAMSARRYVQKHLDSVALLKTLGASRAFTLAVSLIQLLIVALAATVVGSAAGYLAQQWLLQALGDLLKVDLPNASWGPLGVGLLASVAVLAGFAFPPLLQLSRVPAIRVLRRDVGPPPPLLWLAFGPAVLAVVGLIAWVVRDTRLFIGFVVGLTVFLGTLALAGWLLVSLAARMRGAVGVAWRYGVANLSRRRAESVVQIAAFGLGLMVLLLLGLVRSDLLTDWRRSLPSNLPNFFFINIPPADQQALQRFLADHGARGTRFLPMIRARLVEVKGRPVESRRVDAQAGQTGQRTASGARGGPRGGFGGFADREQNITWTAELGTDNRIVAGQWFSAADRGRPLVSLSTEFAESLDLKIGDPMVFDVAGERFAVRLASIRKVKWDSFQPNFFIVFAPGLLDGAAGTWMTSAYLDRDGRRMIAPLVKRFPSVSVFDMEQLLGQVRSVIDKAALAVQSVFAFTLFAGLTVLLAAVQASRDERRYESAMLRTLGASRATVRQGVLAEFVLLGLIAGLIAAGGASVAGWWLAREALELPWEFSPWVWVVGLFGGAGLVSVSGWLATRSVIFRPPLATLRGAQ